MTSQAVFYRTVGAIFMSAFVCVVAGCSSSARSLPSSTPSLALSAEQAAAVADGQVTRDEYDAGFRRFKGCLEQSGFSLVDIREEYQVIMYGVPAEAVDSGAEGLCYDQEFRQIDVIWQLSVEDEGLYAEIFGRCLLRLGLNPEGTRLEKEDRLATAGMTPIDCVESQEE